MMKQLEELNMDESYKSWILKKNKDKNEGAY